MEGDRVGNKKLMAEIEEHAINMHKILSGFDYEIVCVPHIISISRHMSRTDLKTYMNMMESLAIGYSSTLNKELANLILIGVTSKTRSVATATKYLDSLFQDLENRVDIYGRRIDMHSKKIGLLTTRLRARENHILRFLFGSRIRILRKRIASKTDRVKRLENTKSKYALLMSSVKNRAHPNNGKPQD